MEPGAFCKPRGCSTTESWLLIRYFSGTYLDQIYPSALPYPHHYRAIWTEIKHWWSSWPLSNNRRSKRGALPQNSEECTRTKEKCWTEDLLSWVATVFWQGVFFVPNRSSTSSMGLSPWGYHLENTLAGWCQSFLSFCWMFAWRMLLGCGSQSMAWNTPDCFAKMETKKSLLRSMSLLYHSSWRIHP